MQLQIEWLHFGQFLLEELGLMFQFYCLSFRWRIFFTCYKTCSQTTITLHVVIAYTFQFGHKTFVIDFHAFAMHILKVGTLVLVHSFQYNPCFKYVIFVLPHICSFDFFLHIYCWDCVHFLFKERWLKATHFLVVAVVVLHGVLIVMLFKPIRSTYLHPPKLFNHPKYSKSS